MQQLHLAEQQIARARADVRDREAQLTRAGAVLAAAQRDVARLDDLSPPAQRARWMATLTEAQAECTRIAAQLEAAQLEVTRAERAMRDARTEAWRAQLPALEQAGARLRDAVPEVVQALALAHRALSRLRPALDAHAAVRESMAAMERGVGIGTVSHGVSVQCAVAATEARQLAAALEARLDELTDRAVREKVDAALRALEDEAHRAA